MIVTPKRAEPPAASGDNGNGALPQTQNSPGRRSDVEAPARAGQPASVPETVNDDLSMLEQDPTRPAAALSVTPATQKAPTGQISNAFVPMQGLLLDTSQPALRANELSGIQRQSGLAMTSEQVGMRARPASDFTGRFNEAARPAAAKPATNIASVAVNPPKPAASITTGSNPAVFAPVSFGDAPKPPQAPADSAVTDNATEAAELPPALIGPLSLRMAAAKGDASAAFEVASRLAEGRGIKQDFKQAMVWYQRSAAKGLAVAQYRLGTLYERGLGTNVDAARARIWYKRAADQGNVKAMHNMAVLSAGNDQAQPDYATAAKWFKEAADRGLADSQFNLGVLTENGLGVAKDPRAAYVWFSLAARGGDKEATRRRDLLQATLDEATLKSAEDQLRGWRAKPTDVKINDPRVAGDQWRNHAVQLDEPSSLPQPMPSQVANPAAAAPPQMPVQVPASRVSRTPLPAR